MKAFCESLCNSCLLAAFCCFMSWYSSRNEREKLAVINCCCSFPLVKRYRKLRLYCPNNC